MQHDQTIEVPCQGATILIPRSTILRNFLAAAQSDDSSLEIHGIKESVTLPPALGQYWEGQGGIYAGLMRGEDGHPDYHLIVSNHPDGFRKEVEWGGYGSDEEGAQSSWDGQANTRALINSKTEHPLADWLKNIEIDGFTDFYIPSRREASLCAATCPEAFAAGWHWTSTQSSAYTAFIQVFDDGGQGNCSKVNRHRVRAVRRFIAN